MIDRYGVPGLERLLGRRRSWMAAAQIVIAVGLCLIAVSDPGSRLRLTIAAALLVAFASATQDVVIDGWRIDAAPSSRQGLMAAAYQLGYRLALICAGAGALYIAEFVELAQRLLRHGDADVHRPSRHACSPRRRSSIRCAPGCPSPTRCSSPSRNWCGARAASIVPILALVALFRLPDFVAGVMANPLYIDLGFSKIRHRQRLEDLRRLDRHRSAPSRAASR